MSPYTYLQIASAIVFVAVWLYYETKIMALEMKRRRWENED